MPLGTGNFFATRRFNTSMLLYAGDTTVLIDIPEPFLRMCAIASKTSGRKVDPAKIDHIVVTHLHGDHCNGLESFAFLRKFVVPGSRPKIHTSQAVANQLWSRLSPSMGEADDPADGSINHYELSDYLDVHPFEFGEKFRIGGIEFETRRTRHAIPCFGFRAHYGGRTFGYSCDTVYDPHHIAFLEPSDLIFHECDLGGMHTPLESLEALPPTIRKKMRLIHLNDDFAGSAKLEAAEEGRIYTI